MSSSYLIEQFDVANSTPIVLAEIRGRRRAAHRLGKDFLYESYCETGNTVFASVMAARGMTPRIIYLGRVGLDFGLLQFTMQPGQVSVMRHNYISAITACQPVSTLVRDGQLVPLGEVADSITPQAIEYMQGEELINRAFNPELRPDAEDLAALHYAVNLLGLYGDRSVAALM